MLSLTWAAGWATRRCCVGGGGAAPGADVVGINITPAQVAHCRARAAAAAARNVRFVCGSATALPQAAGTLDFVLALESAFHFETRVQFFAEAARVLRPGGTIALAVSLGLLATAAGHCGL